MTRSELLIAAGQAEDHTDYALVAAAIAYLHENFQKQPELDEVAGSLGMSPYHLQRVFRRWAGISPKRFLQFLTVEYAKDLLADSCSLLETSSAAGLSGPGRLHDLFVAAEATTPGAYKQAGAGMRIDYGFHPSPFGESLIAVTDRGVCGLFFTDDARLAGDARRHALEQLQMQWPRAELIEQPARTAASASAIFPAGAADERSPRQIRLLLRGTNFQLKVWNALLRIPEGALTTYGEIAHAIGRPTAARAVGQAVGANAIAYLIPCHRVIRATGEIRDYRWGRARKQAILGWEAARRTQAAKSG